MAARFLHVSFETASRNVPTVETTLKTAIDWAKYAPNCWILWSARSVQEWHSYIKQNLDSGDTVLVCEVDLSNPTVTYMGTADQKIWEWLQKWRSQNNS